MFFSVISYHEDWRKGEEDGYASRLADCESAQEQSKLAVRNHKPDVLPFGLGSTLQNKDESVDAASIEEDVTEEEDNEEEAEGEQEEDGDGSGEEAYILGDDDEGRGSLEEDDGSNEAIELSSLPASEDGYSDSGSVRY